MSNKTKGLLLIAPVVISGAAGIIAFIAMMEIEVFLILTAILIVLGMYVKGLDFLDQ